MKIVVVDDEALLVRDSFNLQNEGYQVLTGTNGLEAVELAKDPEIALMILDVMMPEMDGLTACNKNSGIFPSPDHYVDSQDGRYSIN